MNRLKSLGAGLFLRSAPVHVCCTFRLSGQVNATAGLPYRENRFYSCKSHSTKSWWENLFFSTFSPHVFLSFHTSMSVLWQHCGKQMNAGQFFVCYSIRDTQRSITGTLHQRNILVLMCQGCRGGIRLLDNWFYDHGAYTPFVCQ